MIRQQKRQYQNNNRTRQTEIYLNWKTITESFKKAPTFATEGFRSGW